MHGPSCSAPRRRHDTRRSKTISVLYRHAHASAAIRAGGIWHRKAAPCRCCCCYCYMGSSIQHPAARPDEPQYYTSYPIKLVSQTYRTPKAHGAKSSRKGAYWCTQRSGKEPTRTDNVDRRRSFAWLRSWLRSWLRCRALCRGATPSCCASHVRVVALVGSHGSSSSAPTPAPLAIPTAAGIPTACAGDSARPLTGLTHISTRTHTPTPATCLSLPPATCRRAARPCDGHAPPQATDATAPCSATQHSV